jgi:hypothetical protein
MATNQEEHGICAPPAQDFYDGFVSERRRKEKGVPFETVKADLIKRGRLRG